MSSSHDQADETDASGPQEQVSDYETDDVEEGRLVLRPHDAFYDTFSLARCIDEYKSMLPLEGRILDIVTSIQALQVFRVQCDEEDRIPSGITEDQDGAVSVAGPRSAAVPDLDGSSSRPLRHLYMRCLSTRKLLEQGMVAQAWTVLPCLVREAELLGLEQDKIVEESEHCRRIWWLIIDLDAQLSFILGRQPITVSYRSSPKPLWKNMKADEQALVQNIQEFSSFMLEFLDQSRFDHPGDRQAQKFEDALQGLQKHKSRLPQLKQESLTDPVLWTAIADHQFEVQLFEVALHCNIARLKMQDPAQSTNELQSGTNKTGKPRLPRKTPVKHNFRHLLQTVRDVIDVFEYIHDLDHAKAASSWLRCFGLYCASVILAISRLRGDTDVEEDVLRVERALKVFQESTISGVSAIASIGASALGDLLVEIKKTDKEQREDSAAADSETESMKRSTGDASPKGNQMKPPTKVETGDLKLKRSASSSLQDQQRGEKKAKFDQPQPSFHQTAQGGMQPWQPDMQQSFGQPLLYGDITATSFHEAPPQNNFEQPSFPTSAATSFNAPEQDEYSTIGYLPDSNPDFHPPLWVHYPPLWDKAIWAYPGMPCDMMPQDPAPNAYYGQPAVVVNEQQVSEMHEAQNISAQTSLPPSIVSMEDPRVPHEAGARHPTSMEAEHITVQHGVQFYDPKFGRQGHAVSSPIVGDGFVPHMDRFGPTDPAFRRRSIADIRQHQAAAPLSRFGRDVGPPPTPPQESMLSPLSEVHPGSRRNSATPRQIGYSGQPLDRPLMGAQLAVPGGTIEPDHYSQPPSRRQSAAEIHDMVMATTKVSPHGQADMQAWQNHPPTVPGHGPVVYQSPDGSIGQVMSYDPQYQRHLQANQIVSTGVYSSSGGQHWWT
ncbi:hypothetical protein PV08_03336 [Exophiala spinifera]|uniref:Transcription factor domain-containing protein n=1 Tax=Exophiala spinifera TaxID=91928 RepID=A0A0D1YUW5_9EURO|nr:uncharacterized protein PV08_03336 [Exophiala spinifera]KIW19046.1 hypothetical protein PV08_03336 [Exophiala spinifera]